VISKPIRKNTEIDLNHVLVGLKPVLDAPKCEIHEVLHKMSFESLTLSLSGRQILYIASRESMETCPLEGLVIRSSMT
jgi:hypothetical protein